MIPLNSSQLKAIQLICKYFSNKGLKWEKDKIISLLESLASDLGLVERDNLPYRISFGRKEDFLFTVYIDNQEVLWMELDIEAFEDVEELFVHPTIEPYEAKMDEFFRKFVQALNIGKKELGTLFFVECMEKMAFQRTNPGLKF